MKKFENSENYQQFRTFFEHSLAALLIGRPDGTILEANPAACRMFGYTKEEFQKLGRHGVIDPQSPGLAEKLKEREETGRTEGELIAIRKNGERFPVEFVSSVFTDENGEKMSTVMMMDVTQKKEVERKLKLHARMLNEIQEAAIVTDLEGTIMYWNRAAETLYGWKSDEVIDRNLRDLTPFYNSGGIAEEVLEKLRAGESGSDEYLAKRKDGTVFTANVSYSPIFDDEGELAGIIGISSDITQIKIADKKLRERIKEQQCLYNISQLDEQNLTVHELLLKAVNIIPSGFLNPEKTAVSIEWKDELYTSENFDQRPLMISAKSRRFINTPLILKVYILEENRNSDREVFLEEEKLLLEALKNMLAIKIEKIMQKDELISTLEEKESLLMEIHHRVKNNMAVVSGLLEMQAIGSENPELTKNLTKAVLRIKSMATLHEQLYQSGSFSKIRFSDGIKSLIKNLLQSVQTDSRIKLSFDLEPVTMNIYKGIPCSLLIHEVVMNILDHSFDGKESGFIRTKLQEENGNVSLEIEYNGVSRPDEFQNQSNQSIGLTLIDLLTEQLGGKNEYTESENGMVFRLSFPKSDSQDNLNIFEN